MMSPWEELGIAPTADLGLIRKAYAARLKKTRPEDDPSGFARLRAAYEAAQQMAPRIAAVPAERPPLPEVKAEPPRPETRPEPRPEPRQPEPPQAEPPQPGSPRAEAPKPVPMPPVAPRGPMPPPPKPEPVRRVDRTPEPAAGTPASDAALLELPPEGQVAVRNIVDALNRKANFEAARLLYAACDGNLLPLRTEFQLKDRLALALAADEDLRTDQLHEIASRFGWYSATIRPRDQANSPQARLADRIERELAAERAQKAAEQPPPLPPKPQPARRRSGGGFGALFVVILLLLGVLGSLSNPNKPATLYQPPAHVLPLAPAAPSGPLPLLPTPDRPDPRWFTPPRPAPSPTPSRTASGAATARPAAPAPSSHFAATKRAAIAGKIDAMRDVAELYELGQGVAPDLEKSAAWRLEAARAGDGRSMRDYGLMAFHGRGMAADLSEAYRWLTLAERFGWIAPERTEAARKLAPLQRRMIEDAAKTWLPEPPHPPLIDAF